MRGPKAIYIYIEIAFRVPKINDSDVSRCAGIGTDAAEWEPLHVQT